MIININNINIIYINIIIINNINIIYINIIIINILILPMNIYI